MAIRRGNDLLVYLALARFTKVPKLGTLPYFLQRDIKTFFGSYQAARNHANRLLFAAARLEAIQRACRNAAVGKLTPTALHVHRSALELLPPLLRVYEGCARALLGEVRDANIVKLNHREPKVTYLTYPAFDRDAHPALSSSISVNLRTFQVNVRDREYAANPPILHRKELFVPTGYPSREKFERLTAAEEKAGLLVDTTRIGRRMTFQNLLDQSGYALRGHILRKTPTF
jgi:DNA phosphorothioation-associated putative methyltransferase